MDTPKSITANLSAPDPLVLDLGGLKKGINNYHLDIKLSAKFQSDVRKLVNELCKSETAVKREAAYDDPLFRDISLSYKDMMTVLIHRVKTELSLVEINILQFAPIKFVLVSTKQGLNLYIEKQRNELNDLRQRGSRNILKQQEYLVWLKKNQDSILYSINNKIIGHLNKVENKHLAAIQQQHLGTESNKFVDVLFNPMLCTTELFSELFCVEKYILWQKKNHTVEFNSINEEIEAIFEKFLPAPQITPLSPGSTDKNAEKEMYDDAGGLLASTIILGPALDLKNNINAEFCWLESNANVETVFDLDRLQEEAQAIRKDKGFKAWWAYRKQINLSRKILKKIGKSLAKRKYLAFLIASSKLRPIWQKQYKGLLSPLKLCLYLCGELTEKAFIEQLNKNNLTLTEEQSKELKYAIKEIQEEASAISPVAVLAILTELSRFRLHLKYYRFAHRIFNRISILENPEECQLSREAGTLYQLPIASEVEDDAAKILHHTVLKADIRGSTTVTEELENQGLNPASYFSLRFFSPINKVLRAYGANKVFIEGDAIILSFLEHEHSPEQWFSVARSCGNARAMLAIVHANNTHSRQMRLPPLELGIGICYSDDAPRFLYDEEKPIMISSAIGLADRLSSCSWKLRKVLNPGAFNVQVMEINKGETERGEKGQQYIRYNVNGILLENEAFTKLCDEITMRRVNTRIDGQSHVFYEGEYPDTSGKKRYLLIREGTIGLWKDDSILPNDSDQKFYEVVTNGKVISMIQNK